MHSIVGKQRLLQIHHPDEDVQRRGRNVLVLALGFAVFSLFVLILTLLSQTEPVFIGSTVLMMLVCGGVALLARRGHVTIAGLILVCAPSVGLLGVILLSDIVVVVIPFNFLISILMASIVLPPRLIALTLGINLFAIALAVVISDGRPLLPIMFISAAVSGAMLCGLGALIGAVGASSVEQALRAARLARQQAENSTAALAQTNATLETRVAERTATLAAALATQQAQANALAAALEAQQALSATVLELSLPLLPVQRDTLVLPLIGALDSQRISQMHERVLTYIAAQHTRTLILDVTGVPLIDTQVAQGLVQTAGAARLLGARTVRRHPPGGGADAGESGRGSPELRHRRHAATGGGADARPIPVAGQ